MYLTIFDRQEIKSMEKTSNFFVEIKKRLRLPKLLLTDHFSSLTNHKKITVFIHLFVHVEPSVVLTERIVSFFSNQMFFKMVIMVFFLRVSS